MTAQTNLERAFAEAVDTFEKEFRGERMDFLAELLINFGDEAVAKEEFMDHLLQMVVSEESWSGGMDSPTKVADRTRTTMAKRMLKDAWSRNRWASLVRTARARAGN